MASPLKQIDWMAMLSYAWHVALLGGATYVQLARPDLAPVIVPAIQAAGQVTPPPSGMSILKQDGAAGAGA